MIRRLCFISDTHGSHHDVTGIPECDVLVHSGDMSADGGKMAILAFLLWFQRQPGAVKILVAGNHDWFFQKHNLEAREMVKANCSDAIYLQDERASVMGLRFWGSPYTPTFMDWYFMADRGEKIKEKWDLIPKDTDVLVTHGPPYSWGDTCPGWNPVTRKRSGKVMAGCEELLNAVTRIKPKIHAFGHIHAGHGHTVMNHEDGKITQMINASLLDEAYLCKHPPIVYDIAT